MTGALLVMQGQQEHTRVDACRDKPMLQALAGEILHPPPIWMMRQAGRYLPEYRRVRAQAGSFLDLCFNSELAAEVTLQPIRRFGFDAAIIFADILLIPKALGAGVEFVEGTGPVLDRVANASAVAALHPADAIDETLAPVYQSLRLARKELPREVALIGFAGAPWTVATYMIAGRGTPDQGPAHRMRVQEPAAFRKLIKHLTRATIRYLAAQIEAGAEVVKLFDSWAGSLSGNDFRDFALDPARTIISALKTRYPEIPVIGFPRGAGDVLAEYATLTRADCIALDETVQLDWAASNIQPLACVQGNLAPGHMVTGGPAMDREVRNVCRAFSGGPHVFNLGHGITPDGSPGNVQRMIEVVRGG